MCWLNCELRTCIGCNINRRISIPHWLIRDNKGKSLNPQHASEVIYICKPNAFLYHLSSTSQRPPLSGHTRLMTLSFLSLLRVYFTPSSLRPLILLNSDRVIDGFEIMASRIFWVVSG